MSTRRCDAVISVNPTSGVEALCPKPATWVLAPSGWGWCDEHMDRLAEDGDPTDGYERVEPEPGEGHV